MINNSESLGIEFIGFVQNDRFAFNTTTTKILVKVEGAEGVFKIFGTAPAAILNGTELRGLRVKFAAELEPKEAGFGWFKRPTKAALLEA